MRHERQLLAERDRQRLRAAQKVRHPRLISPFAWICLAIGAAAFAAVPGRALLSWAFGS